jgi:hypothetical protein
MLLTSASTQDNVQFVAVHSPATEKNLRKTRKPRKKAIRIASPMKSSPSRDHKGTLYLATFKTGKNEIYIVAISIQHANECYDGRKMFLTHFKGWLLIVRHGSSTSIM